MQLKEMVASYSGYSPGHAAKEMSKFILSRMIVLCTVYVWQGQLENRWSSFSPLSQEEVVESPDVHFEPLVKLPAMEVKTMEEGEEEQFKM